MDRHKRPFYSKFVWKDWIAKTRHLSPEAKGVYMDLLAYCATNSGDLCSMPDDEAAMRRLTGCIAPHWARIRGPVLAMFELQRDEKNDRCMYVNSRLREDALWWAQHTAAQRLRRTGGRPTEVPERDQLKLELEVRRIKDLKTLGRDKPSAEFMEWYRDEYPRCVKRPAAWRAWCKALVAGHTIGEIIAGTRAWVAAWHASGTPQDRIPHPATFLNGEQYRDVEEAAVLLKETKDEAAQSRRARDRFGEPRG